MPPRPAEPALRDDVAALLGGYRALPGVRDELVDEHGRPRPHWATALEALARMGREEVGRAFALADRHQRDTGVYYRVYDAGESRERAWPLSHLPLVIPQAEWREVEAGLKQRAALLDRVLADAYGPAGLVRDGALPAAALAASPDFLRPMVRVTGRGAGRLQVYAADLGRGADGRWWVLGDRAQAPSGMGYALENRIALSRALPDLYAAMNVRRLAPFFQAWRGALAAQAGRESSRIGLLTPGPLNETYFEHAYLSRYLGFLLVEGGDLTVRDDAVYVRTIGGLKKVDVLVRRLDAEFADPVELDPDSRIGAPGLAQAVRAGSVVLANPLGAGLLESRALLAFLPALARRLLGEDLKLPNVATWWCGQEAARDAARARLEEFAVAPAYSRAEGWPFGTMPVRVAALDAASRARLDDWLERRAVEVVAQEPIGVSTMPVWRDGRLRPRPFTLRAFVVATPDGWEVLPGGFCRLSDDDDPRSLSMQLGGRSADVWIAADEPVEPATLLPTPDRVAITRVIGYLPSRAAENLFWLGRYMERAEATLRAVRCLAGLAIEHGEAAGPARAALARAMELLAAWGAAAPEAAPERGAAARVIGAALSGADRPGSVLRLASEARRAASVIRDRLSPDAVRALADLSALFERRDANPPGPGEALETADQGLRILAALSGLVQENMNRLSGWRFLEIGRRIERGILTARFVRRFAEPDAPSSCLDALLEICDSQITYRARYLMGALRAPLVDLVMLDDGNPRSVAFQVGRLADHVGALAELPTHAGPFPPRDIVADLASRLRGWDAAEIDAAAIVSVENRLMELSNEIGACFFTQADAPSDDDSVEDGG
ncbi:circularly permuted type 2 ATP-grasp protein [Alsobacter sp. SYSU M60028]|uniref:Circularly permuted type 2 ATP-grasp protein n=1 Tax=Alsobacter ponti TaxID=2962936 RepID=A0ABT1LGN5_9HYPH|nr:circularly permuted type 2 ATP-grasp protein [Alsobacter ponti]MCP8940662.1 circularly permuted type 2 ATP-grasp protein [Alsobacter ponti]